MASTSSSTQQVVSALNIDVLEPKNEEATGANPTKSLISPQQTEAFSNNKLGNGIVHETKPLADGIDESSPVIQHSSGQTTSDTANVEIKTASSTADDSNTVSASDMKCKIVEVEEDPDSKTTTDITEGAALMVVNATVSTSTPTDTAVEPTPIDEPVANTENLNESDICDNEATFVNTPSVSTSLPNALSNTLNITQAISSNCDSTRSNVDECSKSVIDVLKPSECIAVTHVESNSTKISTTASTTPAEPQCFINKFATDCKQTQYPQQETSLASSPTLLSPLDPNCSEPHQNKLSGDRSRATSIVIERSSVINSTSCDNKSRSNITETITDKGGGNSIAAFNVNNHDSIDDRDKHRPRELSNTPTPVICLSNRCETSRTISYDKPIKDNVSIQCIKVMQNEALVKSIPTMNFPLHSTIPNTSNAVYLRKTQTPPSSAISLNGRSSIGENISTSSHDIAVDCLDINTSNSIHGKDDLALRMTSPSNSVVSSHSRQGFGYNTTSTTRVINPSTTAGDNIASDTFTEAISIISKNDVMNNNIVPVESVTAHQRIIYSTVERCFNTNKDNLPVKEVINHTDQPYETLDLTNSIANSDSKVKENSVAKSMTSDLSTLRMKPPDFSKLTPNLHVPNPDFSRFNDLSAHQKPKTIVNSSNFAEISKKYNYISDLQLKNPSEGVLLEEKPAAPKWHSNLYVKTPDFSAVRGSLNKSNENTRERPSTSSAFHTEVSLPDVKLSTVQHLTQDVTMSVVNTSSSNLPPKPHNIIHESKHAIDSKPLKYSTDYNISEYHYKQAMAKNYEKCRKQQFVSNHYVDAMTNSAKAEINYHPYRRPQELATSELEKPKNKALQTIHSPYSNNSLSHYGSAMHIRAPSMPLPIPTASPPVSGYDYGQTSSGDHVSHMRRSASSLPGNSQISPHNSVSTRLYDTVNPATNPINQHIRPDSSPSPTIMNSRSNKSSNAHVRQTSNINATPHNWVNQTHQTKQMSSPHAASSPHHFQRPILASSSPQSIPSSSPSPYHNVPSPNPYHQQSMQSSVVFDRHGSLPPPLQNSYYHLPHQVPRHGQDISMKESNTRYHNYLQRELSPSAATVDSNNSDYYQRYLPPPSAPLIKSEKFQSLPTKTIGFVDLTKSITPIEQHKYNRLTASLESATSQKQPLQNESSSKYTSDNKPMNRTSNHFQKTIVDPYLFRHASEADLNMQIIKKTLNKDVSMRRSDTDLGRNQYANSHMPINALDAAGGINSSNNHTIRGTSSTEYTAYKYGKEGNVKSNAESNSAHPIKNIDLPSNRYDIYEGSQILQQRRQVEHIPRHEERLPRVAAPNFAAPRQHTSLKMGELQKHDLSVTVSKFSQSFMSKSSEVSAGVASVLPAATAAVVKTEPEQLGPIQMANPKPYSTVLKPIKRESPLDLSVKTVKTKADSTGSDDISGLPHVGEIKQHHPLQVNFEPNFTKLTETLAHSDRVNNPIPPYYVQSSSKIYPPHVSRSHRNPMHGYPFNEATARQLERKPVPGPQYIQTESKNNSSERRIERNVPRSSLNFETKFESYALGGDGSPYRHIVEESKTKMPNPYSRKGIDKINSSQEYNALPVKSETHIPTSTIVKNKVDSRSNQITKPNESTFHEATQLNSVKIESDPYKNIVPSIEQQAVPRLHMDPISAIRYDKHDINQMRPAYHMPTDSRKSHSTYAVNPFEEPIKKQPYKQSQLHGGQVSSLSSTKRQSVDTNRKRNSSESEQYHNSKQPRIALPYTTYESSIALNSDSPRKDFPNTTMYQNKTYHYNAPVPTEFDRKSQNHNAIPIIGNFPRILNESYIQPLQNNKAAANGPIENPTNKVIHNARERIPASPPYPPPPLPRDIIYAKPSLEKGLQYQPQHYYQQAQQLHPQSYQYQVWHPPKATETDRLNMKPSTPVNGRMEINTDATMQKYQMTVPPKQEALSSGFYYNPPAPSESRPTHLLPEVSIVKGDNKQAEQLKSTTQSGLKGADQMVITKLRNSLELKEIEKQRVMRTAQSGNESFDDDANKADIASIIAARIRTKGELKGFTSLPYIDPKIVVTTELPSGSSKLMASAATSSSILLPPPKPPQTPKVSSICREILPSLPPPLPDGKDAFNLMDWGSACNDFVEQLQTGKKRRRKASVLPSLETPTDGSEFRSENLPGTDYQCHIDESVVMTIKAECWETLDGKAILSPKASSSDEDKPLFFLRQQSLNEKMKKELSDLEKGNKDEAKPSGSKTKAADQSDVSINSKSSQSSDKDNLSMKIGRNSKEKQRIEQEKRLAARLSPSSSSEEENSRSSIKRVKKITRKPRTRSSVGMQDSSGKDSSGDEADKKTKSLGREDSKKRKKTEKLSSDSEPVSKKKIYRRVSKLLSDNEEQSDEENSEFETKASHNKDNKPLNDTCSSTEDEAKTEGGFETREKSKGASTAASAVTSKKAKKENKEMEKNEQSSDQQDREKCGKMKSMKSTKSVSADIKVGETMTRAKKKLVMEQQIANGKVLRNEKIVQNVVVEKRSIISGAPTLTTTHDGKKIAEKDLKANGSKSTKRDQSAKNTISAKTGIHKDRTENAEKSEVMRTFIDSGDEEAVNDHSKKKLEQKKVQSSSSGTDSEETADNDIVVERLRPRKIKHGTPEKIDIKCSKEKTKTTTTVLSSETERKTPQKNSKKGNIITTNKESLEMVTKFQPGWEEEVYQFKRSLKIPQSLITVGRGEWQRKSTSLPDLDPHSSDASESVSGRKKKGKNSKYNVEKLKKNLLPPPQPKAYPMISSIPEPAKHKSIIEVLHQRVGRPLKSQKRGRGYQSNNSESKIMPQSNESELLPTPGADSEHIFGHHKTIFETAVLTSRTRTEYRVNKTKEIIREVFGCDDRPASAPPMVKPEEGTHVALSFVEKCQQGLNEMCIDYGAPLGKNKISTIVEKKTLALSMKTVVTDVASTKKVDSQEITIASGSDKTAAVIPVRMVKKKGKSGRGSRRKGSSGFDYIRKKKKPVTDPNVPHVKRKSAAINYLEEKDENDISREIRGWVLNKGVGESVLHKAARLGYADVIAFCLERLEMHPDPKDNAGYTPLHEACSRGRIDIARLLLQYGANHSETAHSGIRPLHEASENGFIEVCRLLLSYGADPMIATYTGQTPLMLAEDDKMVEFLKGYLNDAKEVNPNRKPWQFLGPWDLFDGDENGFDIFADAPNVENQSTAVAVKEEIKPFNKPKPPLPPPPPPPSTFHQPVPDNDKGDNQSKEGQCDSNSNIMLVPDTRQNNSTKNDQTDSSVDELTNISWKKEIKLEFTSPEISPFLVPPPVKSLEVKSIEEDGELFEAEESDIPLPPLYRLKEEGTEKWVLLTDLLSLMKVKSKDALLKLICPTSTSAIVKELQRELKMEDFLREATCMQLLCAGEKLNMRSSSKVVLIRYNDNVKNLLGVNTILMRL